MTALTLERMLPAPPERVWRALTDDLAAWFWPPRFATAATLLGPAGSAYRIRSEVAGIGVSGEVVAAVAPELLELTWRWDGEATATRVVIRLAPTPHGTELYLEHDGFADDAEWDEHVAGWESCLDRLPDHLAPRAE